MEMDSAVAPEISALEAFLEELSERPPEGVPALRVISSAYHSTHESAEDPLRDLMRTLFSLPAMLLEMPQGAFQKTAGKCLDALSEALSTEAMIGDWTSFKRSQQRNIDIALATITIFHDVKFDGPSFSAKKLDITESISQLKKAFFNSGMSHQSISVINAQIQLLENSVSRFETTGVGPFRDSYFSVLGRVVIEIHKDEAIDDAKRAELVKNFLSVAGAISTVGDIVSLTGPVIAGLLTGPK